MDHEAGRGTSSATGPFDTWSARDPAARRPGGAPGTTCAHVCAAPRPPGAGVAPRPRPRGCERPRGDGADLERVAARLGGRLTTTPVTCCRRGSLSVACHRGAPIPEGTRRQSRAGVTPARRSPDSGSAPQGPLCHGFWSERTWTKREGFHDSAGEVGGRQRWGLWLARHGPGGRRSQRSDGVVADRPHTATRVPPVSSRRGSHTLPGEPLPVTPTLPKLTRTGRRSGRALGVTLTPTFHSSVLLFLLGIHYFLINPISVSSADTSFFNLQLHAEARGGVHSSVSPPSLLPNN